MVAVTLGVVVLAACSGGIVIGVGYLLHWGNSEESSSFLNEEEEVSKKLTSVTTTKGNESRKKFRARLAASQKASNYGATELGDESP